MRLLELQNESDSLQACRTAGMAAPSPDLRGWAALVPADLSEPPRAEGLTVLRGSSAVMFIGTLSQLREVARERVAAIESPQPWRLPRAALPERPLVMG
ncbi:MAG: hypothetical protein ACJ784_00780, partial [Myxococcales bacterium]